MNKREKERWLKKVTRCKDNIADERDKLRELISEAEDIASDCDHAVQALEFAADSLSKYL